MARTKYGNANCDKADGPALNVYNENDAVVVRIPVEFYRRNGRRMVLTQNDAAGNPSNAPGPNQTLIANLAKAYWWQEQLESGEYHSFDELAQAHGVDRTYVSRLLRFTSLSPSLVEQVLVNRETAGMTIRQLLKGVPVVWAEQRAVYGS